MFYTSITIVTLIFVFMTYKNWKYISALDQISFSIMECGESTEAEVRFVNNAVWKFSKQTQPLMNNINLTFLILFVMMILNTHHYTILLVNMSLMVLWCSLFLVVVFIMERTDRLTDTYPMWMLISLAHMLNIVLCIMTIAFLLIMVILEG